MFKQARRYTRDEIADWPHHPDNEFWDIELLEGEVIPRIPQAYPQGVLTVDIVCRLYDCSRASELGFCAVGSGYYPANDPYTLVVPDIAYLSHERDPGSPPDECVATMPDLAVEMLEPWDSLEKALHKADVYLRKGTSLFWIAQTKPMGITVCRLTERQGLRTDFLGMDDTLTGEHVLPNFEIAISKLFAALTGRGFGNAR
ncbi:MAG: Uma2 family endonuclease [Chloroflexi bacterium]|nr:Uma2 family endonuclease [Chloroflexota bacterium]